MSVRVGVVVFPGSNCEQDVVDLAVGGVLFDASGYQSTFIASAVVLLLAAFLTFQTSRAQARQGA